MGKFAVNNILNMLYLDNTIDKMIYEQYLVTSMNIIKSPK